MRAGIVLTWGNGRRRGIGVVQFNVVMDVVVSRMGTRRARTSVLTREKFRSCCCRLLDCHSSVMNEGSWNWYESKKLTCRGRSQGCYPMQQSFVGQVHASKCKMYDAEVHKIYSSSYDIRESGPDISYAVPTAIKLCKESPSWASTSYGMVQTGRLDAVCWDIVAEA